mgnify:CR=1 FL=1
MRVSFAFSSGMTMRSSSGAAEGPAARGARAPASMRSNHWKWMRLSAPACRKMGVEKKKEEEVEG